jgi:SHS2 domain-containing protein
MRLAGTLQGVWYPQRGVALLIIVRRVFWRKKETTKREGNKVRKKTRGEKQRQKQNKKKLKVEAGDTQKNSGWKEIKGRRTKERQKAR